MVYEQFPLGPARLYDNTFEMQSSWDPGILDLRDINYPSNIDFGTFLRDCRRDAGSNPIHFVEREPGACPENIDGLVMAHAEGKGVLARFWMTALDPLTERQWGGERIAVYVDGEKLFSTSLAELAAGKWPEIWYGQRISGCLLSYRILPFNKDLWIVLEGARTKMYYYQADLVRGELPVKWKRQRLGPSDFEDYHWTVTAGTTTLWSDEGPGVISDMRFGVEEADAVALRDAELRFSFDGVTSTVRVGDLCNAAYVWRDFKAYPISVGSQLENGVTETLPICWLAWGWPYAKKAFIQIAVTAPAQVEFKALSDRGKAAARFEDMPPGRFFAYTVTHESNDAEFLWADLKGRGRLVAVLYAGEAEPDPNFLTPDALNWLESDEILYVDGKMAAHGTGTEDFYNGGFYFNEGPFVSDFEGLSFGGVSFVGEADSGWGRAQMARYFLGADQINFQKSFRATWEVAPLKHRMRLTPIFYVAP